MRKKIKNYRQQIKYKVPLSCTISMLRHCRLLHNNRYRFSPSQAFNGTTINSSYVAFFILHTVKNIVPNNVPYLFTSTPVRYRKIHETHEFVPSLSGVKDQFRKPNLTYLYEPVSRYSISLIRISSVFNTPNTDLYNSCTYRCQSRDVDSTNTCGRKIQACEGDLKS